MKTRIFLIFIGAMLSLSTFGQIRVDTFGQQMFIDSEGNTVKEEVKDESSEIADNEGVVAIKSAFRDFDFVERQAYFTPILWKERSLILDKLNTYTNLFNSNSKNGLYENATYSYTGKNYIGVARFYANREDVGILRILYTYEFKNEVPIVNSIVISRNGQIVKEFPQFYNELKNRLAQLDALEATGKNLEKINFYNDFLKYLEDHLVYLDGYLKEPQKSISGFYGSLAWYNNLAGDGASAVQNSIKGINHYPDNVWINTNLALGYLISGRVEDAKVLYKKYKDTPFRGSSLKSMFLDDLKTVEDEGILIPNVDEIREILK